MTEGKGEQVFAANVGDVLAGRIVEHAKNAGASGSNGYHAQSSAHPAPKRSSHAGAHRLIIALLAALAAIGLALALCRFIVQAALKKSVGGRR